MNYPPHLARALLTLLGFTAFLMMALGSEDDRSSYSPSYPSPESIGQEIALTWAKSSSAELARKINQVEMRKNHAQSEVYKLQTMQEQFPVHADKIAKRIKEWQQVVIELDLTLAAIEKSVAAAYVVHQAEGKDEGTVLREVYSRWSPKANDAIALAKKQRAKSGGQEL